MEIIALPYIHQLVKFGDSVIYSKDIMVQKIYYNMHPVSCTNTHHDVTDFENHGIVKNTKT